MNFCLLPFFLDCQDQLVGILWLYYFKGLFIYEYEITKRTITESGQWRTICHRYLCYSKGFKWWFCYLFWFSNWSKPHSSSGPLSSVWKEWVKWCIEFGIEANAIIAVPYDWRLSPSKLEERDLYFHKLKFVFSGYHLCLEFRYMCLLSH